MREKAVILISGGIDSILAAKISLEAGIELHGLFIKTIFFTGKKNGKIDKIEEITKKLKFPFSVLDAQTEYIKLLRKPEYGYGKNFNPCIDCHAFFLKKAKKFLNVVDADFIITGDVAGQRPMSQNIHSLNRIDKIAGVKGFVLRPLSAKLLEPTEPEKLGVISRDNLLDISGRSRSRQKDLIKEHRLRIKPFSGGGCLLTEPSFTGKVRDYFMFNEKDNYGHINLLKTGRHFRISPQLKFIVGRNENENNEIELYKEIGELLYPVDDIPGPTGLIIGKYTEEELLKCAKIISRYSDTKGEKDIIHEKNKMQKIYSSEELPDEEIEKVRL